MAKACNKDEDSKKETEKSISERAERIINYVKELREELRTIEDDGSLKFLIKE